MAVGKQAMPLVCRLVGLGRCKASGWSHGLCPAQEESDDAPTSRDYHCLVRGKVSPNFPSPGPQAGGRALSPAKLRSAPGPRLGLRSGNVMATAP